MEQKVIQVGNSVGVVIPINLREQNNIKSGGKVVLSQVKEGILISPSKKQLAGGIDVRFAKMVDEFITDHEDVLKELAQR
mgnify:CR=1 FL=1